MGKWLLRAVLCLVLMAGLYVALPWYSASQLVEAAHHEDTATLVRYVDFPQLRANIRQRLQGELQESLGTEVPPELGDLFTAGADLILGPLVDRLISPRGISELIQGRKDWRAFERDLERAFGGASAPSQSRQAAPAPQQADANQEDAHAHRWQLRHWYFMGFNTVAVICGSDGEASEVKLLLQRNGLRWQLVDMQLINSRTGGE